jgi:hypothetical protein
MRSRSFLLVLLAAMMWAKGTVSDLSVTTTFASADASGTITDIQSDGLGPYSDGVAGIGSILTTNGYNHQIWGDWQFDDLSSTTRKVSISFANPIQPSSGGSVVPIRLSRLRTSTPTWKSNARRCRTAAAAGTTCTR